jgi:hypothetical protein
MIRSIALVGLIGAALVLSLPAAWAQAQDFAVKDGVITFDKKGFKEEFDKMQRSLRGTRSAQARRSREYCISCADGSKLGCKAIVGGRVGQGLCGLGGAASCPPPGTNGVTSGPCGTGSVN